MILYFTVTNRLQFHIGSRAKRNMIYGAPKYQKDITRATKVETQMHDKETMQCFM